MLTLGDFFPESWTKAGLVRRQGEIFNIVVACLPSCSCVPRRYFPPSSLLIFPWRTYRRQPLGILVPQKDSRCRTYQSLSNGAWTKRIESQSHRRSTSNKFFQKLGTHGTVLREQYIKTLRRYAEETRHLHWLPSCKRRQRRQRVQARHVQVRLAMTHIRSLLCSRGRRARVFRNSPLRCTPARDSVISITAAKRRSCSASNLKLRWVAEAYLFSFATSCAVTQVTVITLHEMSIPP